jgi:type IV secretory pathway VirJ component
LHVGDGETVLTFRRITWIAVVAAVLASLIIGWSAWLGWFGGRLFTAVPAAAPGPKRVTVIFFSGDLGFRTGMGPRIAARLAARGIPVIGVNSLVFFNRSRSAAESAGLIEIAIAQAARRSGDSRVVLVGESFGADMLQVGLSALPPRERGRIALVALIVPGEKIQFVSSPAGLLSFASPETSGLPTARRLDWGPVVCIQGMEETDSLCPLLHFPNVTRITLPGGHLLHYDVNRLSAVLTAAISAATAPGASGSLLSISHQQKAT